MTKSDEARKDAGRSIQPTTRRDFVVGTLGSLTGVALGGCGDADNNDAASGATGSGSTGGPGSTGAGGATTGTGGAGGAGGGAGGGSSSSGSGSCTLYPQQTEGPYYLDGRLVRKDITEGKPGAPMKLEIMVLSAAGCTPIEGAAVDVWQNDAGGVYSGYPDQVGGLDTTGQTFLRGTQMTDADGVATFDTIYPGWYPGRTTHIHLKVHLTSTTEVTSQIYFPEDVTAAVYTKPPYDAHGQKNTSNAADGIANTGGALPTLAEVNEMDGSYVATLTIAVAG